MINTKISKATATSASEEKLFKLLESIDWKLWEIMNMIKDNVPAEKKAAKKTESKKD